MWVSGLMPLVAFSPMDSLTQFYNRHICSKLYVAIIHGYSDEAVTKL
jgi:hypothetical protein